MVAVPGYGHRHVLDAAAPFLRSEQVVMFSSHMSLAALYLAGLLRKRGVATPIAALGTTVTTGRQTGLDAVNVSSIRTRLDVAVLPASAASRGMEVCRALFGDRFVPRDGLLAIALSNLNPQNHLAIALCNLTRMELGETWGQNGHITPAVGRLIEALDAERLAIAARSASRSARSTSTSICRSMCRWAARRDGAARRTARRREPPDHARHPLCHRGRALRPGADDPARALAGVPVPLHECGVA